MVAVFLIGSENQVKGSPYGQLEEQSIRCTLHFFISGECMNIIQHHQAIPYVKSMTTVYSVTEWTFMLAFKYYIRKCKCEYIIKYIKMHCLESTDLDSFSWKY